MYELRYSFVQHTAPCILAPAVLAVGLLRSQAVTWIVCAVSLQPVSIPGYLADTRLEPGLFFWSVKSNHVGHRRPNARALPAEIPLYLV